MAAIREPGAITHDVEADGYARARYRGRGKRGQPSRLAADIAGIRRALRELEACHAQLVRASENTTMTRVEKREVHRAALGRAALGGRFLDEVLLRPQPE